MMDRREFGKLAGAAVVFAAVPSVVNAEPLKASRGKDNVPCFVPGYETGRDDLTYGVYLSNGDPVKPGGEVVFSLYGPDPHGVLIGTEHRVPVNPETGCYYAAIKVPSDAEMGKYWCRWSIMQDGKEASFIEQPFKVVSQTLNGSKGT